MKSIYEIRVFNRYTLISCITLFLVLAISWFFVSHFAEIIFMDYSFSDDGTPLTEAQQIDAKSTYLSQILSWEMLVDSSMFYLINFIAIFFALPTLNFFQEKKSYFILGRHRFRSLTKSIVSSILSYSLISGLCTVFTFLLFYSIGGLFVTNDLDYLGEFASIFPDNFYAENPYLFFVFMVCTIYFALAFVFGMLSCGLMLWVDNQYYVLVGVLVFYFVYGVIGVWIGSDWTALFGSIVAFNTYRSTGTVFLPLIPILSLALLLVIFGIRKYRYDLNG